jgi:hypothetical protein
VEFLVLHMSLILPDLGLEASVLLPHLSRTTEDQKKNRNTKSTMKNIKENSQLINFDNLMF